VDRLFAGWVDCPLQEELEALIGDGELCTDLERKIWWLPQ